MSKHTPGEWKIEILSGFEDTKIAQIKSSYESNVCILGCTTQRGEANARLIAAAPDAYELLKLSEWLEEKTGEYCWYCGNSKKCNHTPDCKLAAYFAKVEGTDHLRDTTKKVDGND